MKPQFLTPVLLSSMLALSACDDGGSDSSNNPPSNNNTTKSSTLTGTAAVGVAIANADVTASCKDGTGFTTAVKTNEHGQWSGQVDSTKLPCALQVKSATQTLHGYAENAGNVNITPFSDLALALATAQTPSEWFKNYQPILKTTLKTAVDNLTKQLQADGYQLPEKFDILVYKFVIGDAFDKSLDAFADALAANTATVKDYAALVDKVKTGDVTALPDAAPSNNTTSSWNTKDEQALQTISEIAMDGGNLIRAVTPVFDSMLTQGITNGNCVTINNRTLTLKNCHVSTNNHTDAKMYATGTVTINNNLTNYEFKDLILNIPSEGSISLINGTFTRNILGGTTTVFSPNATVKSTNKALYGTNSPVTYTFKNYENTETVSSRDSNGNAKEETLFWKGELDVTDYPYGNHQVSFNTNPMFKMKDGKDPYIGTFTLTDKNNSQNYLTMSANSDEKTYQYKVYDNGKLVTNQARTYN